MFVAWLAVTIFKIVWSCDIYINYKRHRLLKVLIYVGIRSNVIEAFSNFCMGGFYRSEQDVN